MQSNTQHPVLTNELVIDYRIHRELADMALNNGQRNAYLNASKQADATMLRFNAQDWHTHTSTPWTRY